MEISFSLIVLFMIFSTAFMSTAAGANRSSRNRKPTTGHRSSANGHRSPATDHDMFTEIDTLLKSWNRIGRRICAEERLSEKKNDAIYNCLRDESDMQTGYENQLLKRCELHILKAKRLTKNQVRLALCRNNHQIIEKFSVCHSKMKHQKPAKLNSRKEFNKMIRSETKKIRAIVSCISKTLD